MKIYSPYMIKDELNYKVPNLEKGLAVIEYLAAHSEGRSLQEIKTELNVPQTTVYRMLNTLVRLNYLSYNEESKRYKTSLKLLNMGFQILNEHNLIETVLPHLRELRDKVKETSCFGVLGDEKGVFIEQAQGSHAFCFVLTSGKTFELHCSAPGKAIMAYLPKNVRNRYLSYMQYPRYNERTITSEKAYLRELEKVLENGYALDMEEELSGVICIGAPIFKFTGYPCGAIWISGPKDRFTKEEFEYAIASVKDAAKNISRDLGYTRK